MKITKEWVLAGAVAILVAISGYLANRQITSIDTSIADLNTSIKDLTGKFDNLTKELGTDRTQIVSLNDAGQQLRDDIHQTRSLAEDNGRKLDTLIKDVAFVQGQLVNVQAQVKIIAPAPQ